jgi:multicomponent Na+:H+ antiporter subunit A
VRRSLILDVVVRLVFHSALLLGVFLLFTGHNRPGGGFVGGLVVGAAIGMRYVAGGIDEVSDALPVRPWTVLGAGLVLATGSALVPLALGDQLLEHTKADVHVGALGDLHLNSALVFDTGVFLVVVGMVLMLLVAFGERIPYFGAPWMARGQGERQR